MANINEFKKISSPQDVKYAAALDPLEPHDPRYVPLAEVRDDDVPKKLYKYLKKAVGHPKQKPAHISYAGHRGNGKTTELFMVMEKLKKEGLFYFVYQAADADLSISDLDYPDIMLYLAKTALEGMPDDVKIDESHLKSIEQWFVDKVVIDKKYYESQVKASSEAKIGFSIPGLLKLLSALTTSITGGHKSTVEIRHVLRRQVSDLIAKMNELFKVLRDTLEKAGKPSELAIVLDNLDRIPPDIMEKAFSNWANLFGQLNVHLIITVPLPLIYFPTGPKLSEMNFRQLVLSMPKIRSQSQPQEKKNQYWEKGVNTLMFVIKSRVECETVFAGEPETKEDCIRRIVLASGGSLRDIVHILGYAGEEAWDEPITIDHVEAAIHTVRTEMMSNLNSDDLKILQKIHVEKRADPTPEVGRQLHYRWALEYNGIKWADVHPLVFESKLYQEAAKINGDYDRE